MMKAISKETAELELEQLKELCKENLNKSNTTEGVDLILNDYIIRAQKYLMVLELPVDWLQKKIAPSIKKAKEGKGSCGPIAQE